MTQTYSDEATERRSTDPASLRRSVASSPNSEADYKRWSERLKQARVLRTRIEKTVWKPLHDRLLGERMLGQDCKRLVDAIGQYVDMIEPHLIGSGEMAVTAKVNRVAAGEDPLEKMRFAEQVGQQGTALMRAIGLHRDAMGRPGEFPDAVMNMLWGVGVMLLGFEAPQPPAESGTADYADSADSNQGEETSPPKPVDLNFARAEHRELHDAGMPFARSIDPRRFLGDASYNDFSKGEWCAVEDYVSIAEARAMFPKYARILTSSHKGEPTWTESDDTGDQEKRGQDDGLVGLIYIYTRRPSERITIAHEKCNCPHVLERGPIELGLEGLPVRLLGSRWLRSSSPYPVPPLLRSLDAGDAENDFLESVFGAGCKIKSMTFVNSGKHPKLSEALRNGDPAGVYDVDSPLVEGDVTTMDVGALRTEQLTLMDKARDARERNAGVSDLALGVREPGDPNVASVQERSALRSARMSGLKKPVSEWMASVAAGLIAIVYEKIDWLHGVMMPVGSGPQAQFAVFDAERPMLGELVDYAFQVQVSDELTTADEVNQLNNTLTLLANYQPLLAAEQVGVRLRPLIETLLRLGDTPRGDEVLYDLPPPEPQPMEKPMAEEQAPPGEGDPAAEMQQLGAALQSLPEGDPQEEAILQRMAELQAMAA